MSDRRYGFNRPIQMLGAEHVLRVCLEMARQVKPEAPPHEVGAMAYKDLAAQYEAAASLCRRMSSLCFDTPGMWVEVHEDMILVTGPRDRLDMFAYNADETTPTSAPVPEDIFLSYSAAEEEFLIEWVLDAGKPMAFAVLDSECMVYGIHLDEDVQSSVLRVQNLTPDSEGYLHLTESFLGDPKGERFDTMFRALLDTDGVDTVHVVWRDRDAGIGVMFSDLVPQGVRRV